MMRKVVCFLVVFMLLVLTSCSESSKPESAVSNFLDASKSFDFEKMATYINESDKEAITDFLENNDNEYQKYFMDYLKSNASKLSYKIKESKVSNNTAVVSVAVKYVDGAPLLKATIAEFFTEALPIAFSGQELTDEKTSEMIVSAMQKQQANIKESFVEKTIDFNCVKVDNQWLIDKPSNEVLDVLMSNFISAGEELDDSFGSNDGDEAQADTVMGQAKEDKMDIIDKSTGEEITFATIKLRINSVKEENTITAEYSEPTVAKEGAKFIILNADITNITNSEFTFYADDIVILDNKGREFNQYSDSIFAIDNCLDCRDLSPSIKENGNLVYELPTDSTGYSLLIAKSGTNELYKILLK